MSTISSAARTTPAPMVPPLRNGDRLTRDEFERRYAAEPNRKKAELIEGVVYTPSPVRFEDHGKQQFNLIGWLWRYVIETPGVAGGDNSSLRLDLDNEPQPDAHLMIKPGFGGQVKIDNEGYIVGAPELVAEVAASSASYDLHSKLHVYRRNGVKEYIVWRVEDEQIDWFVLQKGNFEPLAPIKSLLKSEVFPGLWLDAKAMLADDLAGVAKAVDKGTATGEHRDFVTKLARSGK